MDPKATADPGLAGVPVWPLLPVLGFVPDEAVFSDGATGLSLRHGGLELTASQTVSRYFQPIVLVLGHWRSARSLAQVNVELMPTVDSLDQLKAILAHGIGHDCPANADLAWLAQGHELQVLLPWVQARAARQAEATATLARRRQRPHCNVGRPWMRLFMREIRNALQGLEPETTCAFTFNGEVLVCQSPAFRVSTPATGPSPWQQPHPVSAGALAQLPKRLMSDPIEVGVWEGQLEFGTTRIVDARQTAQDSASRCV